MEVRTALLGYIPVLVATGTLDRSSSNVLQAALDDILEARHSVLFLDLTEVDHMDSSGLAVLAAAVHGLRRGWLGVIGPNADIRRLLEVGGLAASPSLLIFEDRRAALAATGARAST